MKILLIHNFYQQFGGEDAVALADQQLLQRHGDEVLFYTRHNDEIRAYKFSNKLAFFPQTIYSLHTKKEITTVVTKFSPDVAFVHNVFPLISPSVYHVLRRLSVPTVQVAHDFRPFCPNGWFYTQGRICERCRSGNYLHGLRDRCYKNSYALTALYSLSCGLNRLARVTDKVNAFICLTEFYKRKLLEAGIPERKLFIRPTFIDVSSIQPATDVNTGHHALYLGRLSPEKGIWTVVRAFEHLPKVPLVIAGTGPLEREISAYVTAKGLGNIRLVGFKSGEEKWQLLKSALFVIVPSECYENFPVVVLEAYTAGKPVVASDLGGLPFIVDNGRSGLLFQRGNIEDLVGKIRYLAGAPPEVERMGNYARQLVVAKYGPEQSYRNLMAIFQWAMRQ